ncbi:VQ motif-containing protein 9-like [Glycine soja]|uniref:VQ motif-containing protein 9-like n=1 Tax=Glycine soja TaxID=3848 RepID=UPI00103D2A80|nr:VQ motif-containing protein 9-like [Glycine soja]
MPLSPLPSFPTVHAPSESPISTYMPPSSFQLSSLPVPYGCLNSQLDSYPLLSPGLLFSPTFGQLGFLQLSFSSTVPVPSSRWKGI